MHLLGRGRIPDCGDCMAIPLGCMETFDLFVKGDELYVSMLAAIASAADSVLLESYIFADDEIGGRFCQALIKRAQAGVNVKVHIDAADSLSWFLRRIQTYLRTHGVHLRWFHRWSWSQPWRYNHRKLRLQSGVGQLYENGCRNSSVWKY